MTLIDTPAPARQPDDDKHITAAKVRTLYDKGTKAIRNEQLQYQENSAYVEGNQWVFRHSTRQEILNLPRNPKKVRATIPRIGPESRRIAAKLLRRKLQFEVTPDAPDDETVRGARTAEAVASDVARRFKFERLREELFWMVWKGGTGALCVDWDSSAGKYLGQTEAGKDYGQGDIKVSAISITEMVTEPGTRDIEYACYWIKAQALPSNEVKKLYGMSADPAPDVSPATTPMAARVQRTNNEPVESLTLVLTYYERPNKDNKKGVVAVIVGDKIVDGPHPWPFPFKDRLNLACARETLVEGRWTGRTVISDAIPVQTALNASWTSILEHLKQAGNARMQSNEASQDLVENRTDEAAEVIFWRDSKHEWLSPPQMPAWWIEMPARLAAQMDDIIGIHDVSRGAAPANIESGLGLSVLAEQDDSPTGRLSEILADAFSDAMTMILETYEKMVPAEEERKAHVDQPGYVTENLTWNGQSFAGQTTAHVPYEAVAPVSEEARWAKGLALLDRKVLANPRQFSRYIDIAGSDSLIESTDPDVAKARRENYQLAQGEPMVPADFDEHNTHIEEHNVFRKSARYERLDDDTRILVDMHVQAHSTLAAEEAAQQTLKMQFAPALGQAAQGTQPPGSMRGFPQEGGVQPESAMLGGLMGGDPGAETPPQPSDLEEPGMPT